MKTDSKQTVFHAILWAAAMIGTAILLRGSENKESVFLMLLVLSSTSVLANGSVRNEWRCLKAKFSGKGK
ncbi:hypothetical protein [Kordiimonas gwangyangensis]|uniref:hypothetical protein n=1 Tax=Kordiimonas gwangyangensis TaxID=288022 RepID=UPI000382B421|nr:hypothetical protein [Kordiimonas gwangyangensis]